MMSKDEIALKHVVSDSILRPNLRSLVLVRGNSLARKHKVNHIARILTARNEPFDTNSNSSDNVIRLRNGSTIVVGGFQSDDETRKYLGLEYEALALLSPIRNRVIFEDILSVLRTSKPGWQLYYYIEDSRHELKR